MKNKLFKNTILKNFFIIFIFIFFIFVGHAFAKYLMKINQKFLYDAKDFYFESDLLSERNQNSYTYKDGVDYIEFNLNNNVDDLRYSEVNINYVVELTDLDGNNVKNKFGDVVDSINGSFSKDTLDSNKIKFENLASGTYVVTATSIRPYKKQLQANFILISLNDKISYKVSDVKDSPILNLTISTNDYSGNVKIKWPTGVAPNSTDSVFSNVDTGYSTGNVTVPFGANSEYVFLFFKEDSSSLYSDIDFLVERVS